MARNRALIFAGVMAAGMLAAPAAEADWRYRGGPGWGPRYYAAPRYYAPPRYYGPGPGVAGAIIGLGVGAAIAGAFATPPPYYYYAPPPPVYYAPPPVFVPPAPPAYYFAPGWAAKPGW